MLYGVLPRPDARLLPQVLSPHPAPHPGPRTRPRASAPAPRLALWFSRSGPRIRSSHSCLRTPASAPRPALRSRVPGGALRSRAPTQTCPHILPRALGGGFEGRILEGGFRVPGSSSGPRVLALCSGPHNPVLAPRLLAFRPASASHFDPRTPARTPVLHSGPVFREGRLLRFEPALRSSRTGPRTRPRASAPAPRLALWFSRSGPRIRSSHSCLRTPASAPRPALRSRVPGGALRSRAPTQTCPHILPRALGGGFWRRLLPPGPLPHFVPRSRPRAPAPAFPPRIPGGGFEGRFSGDILERRIPGGVFEGRFSGDILERRIPGGDFLVRPPRRVSELRILANQQNKIYL